MNERIRQLYEQAHIERRQEYFSSVVDPTIKSVSVTRHFDLDLFAELLVKECITVARGADGLDATHEAWYLIKQHFGVEE